MYVTTNKYNFNSFLDFSSVGMEQAWDSEIAPIGFLFKHGQLVPRAEYPRLYNWALTNNLIIPDDEWITAKHYSLFSYGDNETTYRIPDKRGLYDVGYEAGYHSGLGLYQQDQFQGHKHTATFLWWDYPGVVEEGRGSPDYGNHRQRPTDTLITDGLNGVPRTGLRTQPRSIPRNYIIKY